MRRGLLLWTALMLGALGLGWAWGQLGDVLKAGGVVLLVNQFGEELNKGINTLLRQNKVEVQWATKVVPIFSIGQGTHVGAAQVAGPMEKVKEVKGVAELEGRFLGRRARARIFVPVRSVRPLQLEVDRVEGVGISAVLELRL